MRTWVKTFKPEFAPMVENRTKWSTIRPEPKDGIIPAIGDTLDARMWRGKPYRSTQIKLACFRITNVLHVVIQPDSIRLSLTAELFAYTYPVAPAIAEAWAKIDGFKSATDMFVWFWNNYELPFKGIRIEWDPR